jgi:hypothetical protein
LNIGSSLNWCAGHGGATFVEDHDVGAALMAPMQAGPESVTRAK